ncbi:GTP-binding protein [Costertonia aggregata]|uniref:GTP-binding protein n=1 Tax=Costertonia aggregata TaxID=343403 RepID=A0A7H9AR52_9FLAO|nr:GTP-binding protein [Costertonia aggregata]QLG45961.1 GTP-binding protein [Costertonia aggregata]
MKVLSNDIVLRPRFKLQLSGAKEPLLNVLKISERTPFLVKRIDDHVFIKFNAEQSHFWSPQLHLEINETEDGNSVLYGLFGPNPTLWTFFIFIHFGIATVFIVLGIWAYSSAVLKKPFSLQMGLMVCMVLIWIALYIFGRLGKHKGKPQMHKLYQFMLEALSA